MEFWQLRHIALSDTDDPILPDAGMANDEDIEVWIEWAGGLEPSFHLHSRGHGEDRGPLTEEGWGFEIIRMFDERFDPRAQLPLAATGCRARCSL